MTGLLCARNILCLNSYYEWILQLVPMDLFSRFHASIRNWLQMLTRVSSRTIHPTCLLSLQRRESRPLRGLPNSPHVTMKIFRNEISSFDELLLKIGDFVKKLSESHWITLHDNNCLCIYTVNVVDKPRITTAIKILRSLNVEVYRGESHITSKSLTWILGKECLLKCWSQLSSLLSHFATHVGHLSVVEQVEVVKQDLHELIEIITLWFRCVGSIDISR